MPDICFDHDDVKELLTKPSFTVSSCYDAWLGECMSEKAVALSVKLAELTAVLEAKRAFGYPCIVMSPSMASFVSTGSTFKLTNQWWPRNNNNLFGVGYIDTSWYCVVDPQIDIDTLLIFFSVTKEDVKPNGGLCAKFKLDGFIA